MIKLNVKEHEVEPNQKHDEGYKGLLSKKENFLHFLKKYIAEPWTDSIDPEEMVRIDKSFITREYRKQDSDLIYKLKMNGEDVYFYVLMELQSSVDFTMPFRLLRYMVELLNDIFANTDEETRERKGFRLPAVVPIILYNGEDNWTAVRSYREYTDNYGIFGDNIINFSYILFDLNRTNDETIISTKKLLDIIFALNKIRPDERKYDETIRRSAELAAELEKDEIIDLLNWMEYVHFKGDVPSDFEEEFKQAIAKGDVNAMTHSIEIMRDMSDQKYLEKGKLENALENALRMIKEGLSFDTIKRVTELPDDELNRLMSK